MAGERRVRLARRPRRAPRPAALPVTAADVPEPLEVPETAEGGTGSASGPGALGVTHSLVPAGPSAEAGEAPALAARGAGLSGDPANALAGPQEQPPASAGQHGDWIAVGEIMGAFGPRGDMRVKPLGRFPERFRELRRVYVGEEHAAAAVLSRKAHGEGMLMRLDTVKSRDAARALFGQFLYVPESEAVKLPEGEFFVHQVIGLRVVTVSGDELGTVRDVLQTGSNDVYVVRNRAREVLIPAIKDVVKRIDPGAGVIEVELLPGLLDEE